ncbi:MULTISPECIES: Cu(I)-responsive transcriptional regulator [Vibrio]|uniref:HTH-type transcriptional regulator CueR n=4 Tax=Vibrio TaxID=662 RepID=A0A7Z1S4U1_9VIBR|nr:MULTISPECIES: Cu(I)-responsive transcriptional regulator [Vibrio]KAA8602194.1 HTH-type transcriptional regulator cueR [Vibrio cyclitrophicus]MBE8605126.1 Cu(I)-responsive transcriptional regulator [Vibrio sp. OPT10]MCC4772860.1 Cu(I)-responsive transcriptional regulator [Vibrio cyclitrophicus]MCC4842365.1 Cu(I)-responsive transcriptional regulator [Vibrio cyclitrophicus]MCZ8500473.1 Cu(I)-responsive transcriptional regulator [Vibrio lentus]|tara:strand:- start:221 stop:616 length:396 start_codon:yes stop_codon:yes gene_type:complete
MNISEAAKLTNLSTKSIRLYEDKGVISAPLRSDNGYRSYDKKQIKELGIVAKARSAGFSLDECRALVELADNPCRESADVKAKAQSKLNEVNRKIEDLLVIQKTLVEWVEQCPGDSNSHCPIIDSLVEKKP